jgi:integrase
LKWSDVNFGDRTLLVERQVKRVEGKGLEFGLVKQGEARSIVLTDKQIEILQMHLKQQDQIRSSFEEDEGLIFPNQLGKKLDDRRDSRNWKKLLAGAGVKHYARYQMRKTAFTNLYAQTHDVRILMEYSGHTQVSTVMRSYVFPSEEVKEHLRKSVDAARPVKTCRIEGAE